MKRAIVGCEYSGKVREALRAQGVDAWSCDLLPAEDNSPFHYEGDMFEFIEREAGQGRKFDMGIFHPPCTNLAVSGARWFKDKRIVQAEALNFVLKIMWLPIELKAIENPISVISSKIRKPEQIIQPWHFGHPEFKATCLWLYGLPRLKHTNILVPPLPGTPEHKEWSVVHNAPPGPDRWKDRSRTYDGIANAMGYQWGRYLLYGPEQETQLIQNLSA